MSFAVGLPQPTKDLRRTSLPGRNPMSTSPMSGRRPDASSLQRTSSSFTTAAASLSTTPLESPVAISVKRKTQRKCAPATPSRRSRSSSHVPRPRNPFMIFRSETYAEKKISLIEHDHRHISRIVAICWKNLSDEEKKPWYAKAAAEKEEHGRKYPNYQYTPVHRVQPPKKRNVRRNGVKDLQRCETVALLLAQGKEGQDLETALKQFDLCTDNVLEGTQGILETTFFDLIYGPDASLPPAGASKSSPSFDVPAFRSPLLPPPELESEVLQPGSHSLLGNCETVGNPHTTVAASSSCSGFQTYDVPALDEPYILPFPCSVPAIPPSPVSDWSGSSRLAPSSTPYQKCDEVPAMRRAFPHVSALNLSPPSELSYSSIGSASTTENGPSPSSPYDGYEPIADLFPSPAKLGYIEDSRPFILESGYSPQYTASTISALPPVSFSDCNSIFHEFHALQVQYQPNVACF